MVLGMGAVTYGLRVACSAGMESAVDFLLPVLSVFAQMIACV